MLNRRVVFRVAVVVLLFAGVGLGIARARRPIQPTRFQFEQVVIGMTREEIIQLVGGPPGNYTDGEFSGIAEAWGATGWVNRECELIVQFDANGIATEVRISPVATVYRPPLLERLRDAMRF